MVDVDGWERARALMDNYARGNVFVRLTEDGDSVVGAFCGEPFAHEVVWVEHRYEAYDPDKHPDKRPSTRLRLNFYVPVEERLQVVEGSEAWFNAILAARRKHPFNEWLFEIRRHGNAKNVQTRYSVEPAAPIVDSLRARLVTLALHDLAAIGKGHEDAGEPRRQQCPGSGRTPAAPAAPAAAAARVAPASRLPLPPPFPPLPGKATPQVIDVATARDLFAQLRTLPNNEGADLLRQFSIVRVRDLKAADEAAARAFIDGARRRVASATALPEVDPFAA